MLLSFLQFDFYAIREFGYETKKKIFTPYNALLAMSGYTCTGKCHTGSLYKLKDEKSTSIYMYHILAYCLI